MAGAVVVAACVLALAAGCVGTPGGHAEGVDGTAWVLSPSPVPPSHDEAPDADDPVGMGCVPGVPDPGQGCAFRCAAGQTVHAFIQGGGRIEVSCGGDACDAVAAAWGGCSYSAPAGGIGSCRFTGVGTARCYSVPFL